MKRTVVIVLLAGALLGLGVFLPLPGQADGQITSPRDRAAVRGLVPVEGSATHPQFQKYEIHFGPEPNPGDQWTPIGGSPFTAPVVQGRLGLWDTTIIPDGLYSLRLRVVRLDGNYDEYFVRGIVVANTMPTETPTQAATATPSAPTNTPAPTPTVLIGVPTMASPTPRPTATPLPTETPSATPEPPNLPLGISSISDAAIRGAGITLAAFVGVGLIFAFKGTLVSVIHWFRRRGQDVL